MTHRTLYWMSVAHGGKDLKNSDCSVQSLGHFCKQVGGKERSQILTQETYILMNYIPSTILLHRATWYAWNLFCFIYWIRYIQKKGTLHYLFLQETHWHNTLWQPDNNTCVFGKISTINAESKVCKHKKIKNWFLTPGGHWEFNSYIEVRYQITKADTFSGYKCERVKTYSWFDHSHCQDVMFQSIIQKCVIWDIGLSEE